MKKKVLTALVLASSLVSLSAVAQKDKRKSRARYSKDREILIAPPVSMDQMEKLVQEHKDSSCEVEWKPQRLQVDPELWSAKFSAAGLKGELEFRSGKPGTGKRPPKIPSEAMRKAGFWSNCVQLHSMRDDAVSIVSCMQLIDETSKCLYKEVSFVFLNLKRVKSMTARYSEILAPKRGECLRSRDARMLLNWENTSARLLCD